MSHMTLVNRIVFFWKIEANCTLSKCKIKMRSDIPGSVRAIFRFDLHLDSPKPKVVPRPELYLILALLEAYYQENNDYLSVN
jgi:hypothetical protein